MLPRGAVKPIVLGHLLDMARGRVSVMPRLALDSKPPHLSLPHAGIAAVPAHLSFSEL